MNMYADTVSSPAILVPAEVFVGDRAKYQYRFTSDTVDLQDHFILDPESFSDFDDASIESAAVTVNGRDVLVVIDFIPWKPGALTLPAVSTGTMQIILPPVRIASILDRTGIQEMRGARPPLLLPGTAGMLYGTAAVSIAVLVIGIMLVKALISVIRRSSLLNPPLRVCRVLQKQLRRLERDVPRVPVGVWLARYQSLVRRLLTVLFDADQSSKTVPEMRTAVTGSEKTQEIAAECINLLDKTDVLRFAGFAKDVSVPRQGQSGVKGCIACMQHADADLLCDSLYGYLRETLSWFRTEREGS